MKWGLVLKTLALACKTIAAEVELAAQKVKASFPILWIESGLHNCPDKLKQHLQEEIDRIANADCILMLFGYCGNALLGLASAKSSLVIPRVDDCISLLLGGNAQRNRLNSKAMAYFLTSGWLKHENNLWCEYEYCRNKYGPERTRQIFKIMLANYKNLNVIKTGAYDIDALIPKTKTIAAELDLKHVVVEGSLRLLCKALRGDWDHHFAIIEPGRPVTLQNLGILERDQPSGLRSGGLGG